MNRSIRIASGGGVPVRAAATLVLAVGSAILAPQSTIAATPHGYPIGWYDATVNQADGSPAKIASEGGNVVIAYAGTSQSDIVQYLNQSATAGVSVILQVPSYYVMNEDTAWIQNYVSTYDSNPALIGWYLVDEPTGHGVSVHMAEAGYQAVKQASTKPVFMAFAKEEFANGAAVTFGDAYDTFLFDSYPFLEDSNEYGGLFSWTELVQLAASESDQVGKPWWSIPQGVGQQPDLSFDKRLPTLNEARYQTYLSVVYEAEGLVSWAHYRAEDSIANPEAPYTDDGEAWLDDVWRTVALEFNEHGDAIVAGELTGAVTDNRASIIAKVYRDPDTGEYYLIAVNTASTGTQPTFTLSNQFSTAAYLSELGADIDLVNGTFTDSFGRYTAHTYKLLLAPEPASVAILAAGMLLAVTRRHRRRVKRSRPPIPGFMRRKGMP